MQKKWNTECIYFLVEPSPYNSAPIEYITPPKIIKIRPVTPTPAIKGFINKTALHPLNKWHITSIFSFFSTSIAENIIPSNVINPTMPKYGDACTSGYTNWNGTDEISGTAGQKIVVVEVDSENKAKKAGITSLTVKYE